MISRFIKPLSATAFTVVLVLHILPFASTVKAQDNYLLQYKFVKGEKLQYKTERHDSTESDMGGQTSFRKVTIWSLETLTVEDVKKDDSFKVSIKNDSTWTDQDPSLGQGMGRGMGGRGGDRRGGGSRDRAYEITVTGKSVSKDPVTSPFIIPLPEEPIAINGTWDFQITSEQRGRRQGTTTITGQCLLYDVQKESNQTLAVIIVNAETVGEGKLSVRREGMDPIEGSFGIKGSATNLVYFDIDKGRIVEVISEEMRESITESTSFSSKSSSKSNTTVRLISE